MSLSHGPDSLSNLFLLNQRHGDHGAVFYLGRVFVRTNFKKWDPSVDLEVRGSISRTIIDHATSELGLFEGWCWGGGGGGGSG